MTPQPAAAPSRIVGVKRLADYLKRKTESDPHLRNVAVRGEISNYNVPRSGHVNFDLKEGDVVLRAFAWASDAVRFPALRNGLAVVATGAIATYPQKSVYQLVARAIELEGIGDVHALFEARKQMLAAEGLFDPARKRAPPAYPFVVALVSSRGANGAIDFVTILRERAPHVRVVWFETSVQGPNAPAEIASALQRASQADVDCIVLTRGGGSFEDLFWFSDERVVRAVARAKRPIVSAIGHTVDQQLCDFAADVHVETPSAAAKAIGFATRELRARLDEQQTRARNAASLRFERLGGRLASALLRSKLADPRVFLAPLAQRLDGADAGLAEATGARVREADARVRDLARRLDAHDPSRRLEERARRLQATEFRLAAAVRASAERARRSLAEADARLEPAARAVGARATQTLALARAHLDGKNPEAILQRGYAIVTYDGAIASDAAAIPEGAAIVARIARGTLFARVERREPHGN